MTQSTLDGHQYSATAYKDADVLRELYLDEDMTLQEIGDIFDVTDSTISNWMEKHGISRSDRRHNPDAEYKDPHVLRELYHEEGLSTHEIGERFGVTSGTIHQWLTNHEIEARSRSEAMAHGPGVAYHTQKVGGYPTACTPVDGTTVQVRVHQLVAIADGADPYKVFSNGEYHVHHRNGCTFDNRPSNLEVLTASEHARITDLERWNGRE